jgi:hypothetical protein
MNSALTDVERIHSEMTGSNGSPSAFSQGGRNADCA